MNHKKSMENFIKQSNEIHNNKFDYSLVEYINAHTKVKIICPVHGVFECIPSNHLRGCDCKMCGDRTKSIKLSNKDSFIKQSNEIHNNKFDYSLVNYINAHTKVKIICPTHGVFKQTPMHHLNRKQGCIYCFQNKVKSTKQTTSEFIEEAKNTHNGFYDYSLTEYVNRKTKVTIICPKHGKFVQMPYWHLKGHGCPNCKSSKGEKYISRLLNEMQIEFTPEHTFDDCRGKKQKLPFDFYLPKYNLCIEYQGIHHYSPVYGIEKYKLRLQYDKIKRNYCLSNNIKLLEIPYTETNIKQLLTNIINNLPVFSPPTA